MATLSPGDLLVEDEIAQQTGCMVASFVALEIRFVEALNRHYQAPITARYAGLVRRLSGLREAVKESPRRPSMDEVDAVPLSSPGAELPRRAAETRRPAAPKPADSLELSAEERDLFPSLRGEETEKAAEPGGISGEVALVREDQPPAPAPTAEAEVGLESLLVAASHAMQNVEMRDDIADAMLGFCAPIFRRRVMLVHRGATILGWRGEGAGVDQQAVRAISIPTDEPSVFSGLLKGVEFWLGPLPAMPHNADLTMALGAYPRRTATSCRSRSGTGWCVFLYGDNQDAGVGGLPLAELKRLAGKAGLAFQVYLLKGKIRAS